MNTVAFTTSPSTPNAAAIKMRNSRIHPMAPGYPSLCSVGAFRRRVRRSPPSDILGAMTDPDGFRSPLAPDANAGSVAIVTGGGTGIGRATAMELARTGANVAICGRRPEPLEAVRRALEEAGAECLAMPTDVREAEQVGVFLDAVDERFGSVDILVNNAGGQFAAPLEAIALKGMRAVHRLNVDATWDVTQRVAERWMIPRRQGLRGVPGVQSAARYPDDDPLLDGAVGAGDARGRHRAGVVEVRHPRGVRRGRA